MDFELNEEQLALRQAVREFMARECPNTYIRAMEARGEYPRALLDRMAELGWFGLSVPPEYGGVGGDILDMALLAEEMSHRWVVPGLVFGRVVYFGLLFQQIGSAWQREELLPRLAQGQLHMYVSFTEVDAGSDLAALSSTAVRDGDSWVINGHKPFSTGSHVADYLLVAARTATDEPKHKRISLFLVDPRSPGVEIKPWDMLGQKALRTNAVTYVDVRVPARNLVGEVNRGWDVMRGTLTAERIMQAASCVGAAQDALEIATEYARTRQQFGQAIGKFQAIAHMLANLRVAVDAARLLTYRAAALARCGKDARTEAAMAKLTASEAWTHCAMDGLQVLGGFGYTMESDIQRHYRDAKLYEIAGGTSQIQRDLIARGMGL